MKSENPFAHIDTLSNKSHQPSSQCCESTKLKHRRLNCKHCRQFDLVKLCNYILISCLVLVTLINSINGIDTTLGGCSSNPCVFGVCIDEINGTYNCYCIDGYTGKQCQTNWDECWSTPCLNGGTCIDGVAQYNCSCAEGFSGVNCEENLDECLSNPCQNGGTCDDRENGYVCTCTPGYAGLHCDLDIAVCNTGSGNKCHNGGQCIEGRGLDFTCDCAAGWKGRFCSIEIDECESSPCQNGAICLDKIAAYACICPVGFTGSNCEEDIQVCNDSPCKNSALCLMEEGSPVCYCVPDFHGEKCEYQYDECQIGPRCSNGGACVDGVDDFTCSCRNDFRGMFCECLQLPNGELDCNYTATEQVTMKMTTPEATTISVDSSTLLSSTSLVSSTTTKVITEDLSSIYTSTITQSVPTTSNMDGSYSTIEILDLKTTEELLGSTTNENDASSSSEMESTPSSTSTEALSSSLMTTAKSGTSKTTKLRPPCPPETTRSTPIKSSTTESQTTATATMESEGTSSTFHSEATSFTASSAQSTDPSTQSTTIITSSTSVEEQTSTALPLILSSEAADDITEKEASESVSSVQSTIEASISTEILKSSTIASTTSESITQSSSSPTTVMIMTSDATTLNEGVSSTETTEKSQSSTMSSSFIPPSTTDDMFTLKPSDVGNVTDCRQLQCFNGGSCVITSEGPKCVCRFDRQDPNCKTLIKIRNAAFGGDSYLSHLIYADNHPDFDIKPLDSILPINIELKARTRATDGLILLAIAQGSKGGHYTALFLHKGMLQFQFSCGLQTMLLSELEAPINTGHEFTIQVALDFSRNHSHCNASLRINDTLAMSGDQPTWLGMKSLGKSDKMIQNIWLHLGGSPQTPVVLMSELPGGQGFTGCLHSLRMNDNWKEIFRDAYDGFGISECGSLACLSNPCRNGGTCEERLYHELDNDISNYDNMLEHRWQCKCPTGYLGASCENSVCDNNPCQYGGTCVEFPGSGYLCLCPIGKHGHYCEHSLEIDQPSFSGTVNGLSSYISYPVPIPLETMLDLSFRVAPATSSQISLLAFIGQGGKHDEKSDHLAVSFIQGYIMLTWNLGNGPRRIFTQKPLAFQDAEDEIISYHVQVVRQGRTASLYIDGKLNVTGNSPGDVSRLDVVPVLYIGGHSSMNFSTLPHDLPLHSGFQGCIYDLQLKSGSLVIPLHETKGVTGRSIGQCGTRECHRHSCHNNGACLQHGATYTCICPDGWFGTLCSQKTNPCDESKCSKDSFCVPLINGYECDCPLGWMGKYCDVNIKYLSDVSLSGKRSYFAINWHNHSQANIIPRDRFRQQMRMHHDIAMFGYDSSSKLMARNLMEHQRKAQLFSLEFQLRPLSESGLLMFLGNFDESEDNGFISLSLNGGVIEFRIAGQQSQLSIVRSNRILAIGEWHKIRLSQNGRRLSLWVEGSSSSNVLQPNSVFYHSSNTLIYIGGLPDISKLPHNSILGFPVPFKGCVRQFYLNGHRYVLNEQTIVESRNIVDCDGTACGGDACDQGGNCYLDDSQNPHCKCPETAKGIHCEIPESCHVIKCKNDGKCMPNGECSCPNGWTGYFCEIATNKFSLPSFNGKSYMIIPSQRYTHKDKRNGISSQYNNRKSLQISLNFSTINVNGMLLWNDNSGNYLGLGLENGLLKVVSNLLSFKNDRYDVPRGGYLTDGAWHNIRLDADEAGQVSMIIDRKNVYDEDHKGDVGNLDLLGDSFWLGGFPQNLSISNRTMSHFHKPFLGCLQGIQISSFNNINNRLMTNNVQQTSSSSQVIKAAQLANFNSQDFSRYEGENIGECELFDEFVNIENSL